MLPNESGDVFIEYLKKHNGSLESLDPDLAVELFLGFYNEIRFDNIDTNLGSDGDMILYQWGTYDWGDGNYFQFDLTRQFIEINEDDDDDAISQLHLTFYYNPKDTNFSSISGDKWFSDPENITEIKECILDSECYKLIKDLKPIKIELTTESV